MKPSFGTRFPPNLHFPIPPDKIKEMSPCNGQHSSGVFGHQLLLEYLEEHPPLLGHLGMGVKLTTFYKKRTETNNAGSQQLLMAAQAAVASGSRGEQQNTHYGH